MELKKRIEKRSYQRVFRDRHIVAQKLSLSDAEYRLWDLFGALYDWDIRHTTFGCVVGTNSEVAKLLKGCDWSASKVSRVINKLINKGLLNKINKSQYKLTFLPTDQVILPQNMTDNAKMQNGNAKMQNENSDSQKNHSQTGISIVSFKDSLKYITNGSHITKLQYDLINQEVDKLAIILEGKWLSEDEKIQQIVSEYERLCVLMLDYEIEHDLLPIGKNEALKPQL